MKLENVIILVETKISKKTGDKYKVVTLVDALNGTEIATSFDKDLRLAVTDYILDNEN